MFKELPDQCWVFLDLGQFLINLRLHFLASLQRSSLAGAALGVAPRQLIGFRSGA